MVTVAGIKITDRIKEAGLVQKVLSANSAVISTRLGFHELSVDLCSREGFIVLHLAGKSNECEKLITELNNVEGTETKVMDFTRGGSERVNVCDGHTFLGIIIPVTDKDSAIAVQKLLTSYGCVIRMRLGVNETYFGESAGLIILEMAGDTAQITSLEKSLRELSDIAVGRLCFA